VDEDDESLIGASKFWPDTDGDGLGSGASVTQCFAPSGYTDNQDDCDDGDAAVGDAAEYYEDDDGDGYGDRLLGTTCGTGLTIVFLDGDCDDDHAGVFPGAVEICDGIDDNCDGLVDDADPSTVLPTWYGDDDGDGYGEDTDSVASCAAPEDYAAMGGDCDDVGALVHPDAYELCDAIDNDCDGTADDTIDYVDWYADDDGDGYGDPADSLNDCSQPSGYVLRADDCDGASADVHPGAVEDCSNGLDDDCDGSFDNCPVDLDSADLIVWGVDLGTSVGGSIAVGDVDADGTGDLVLGAPALGGAFSGAVFVVFGPVSGSTTVDDAIAFSSGITSTDLGADVDAGDADGDGAEDLLLGSPSSDSAYVYFGPITADRDIGDADASLVGATGDVTATFVQIAQDVDGDGVSDLLVGAPRAGSSFEGTVYVTSGASSGTIDLATDATYTYEGASGSHYLGDAGVDVGDATGDGIADFALSAVGAYDGGVVYIVEGGLAPGAYGVATDSLTRLRGVDSSKFGAAVASTDYDSDGTNDLFVGATSTRNAAGDPAGAVYGFLGPFGGSAIEAADAHVRWDSTLADARLGSEVAVDGDLDGDKTPDVLMGAPYAHVEGAEGYGCAYLQIGLVSGSIDVASLRSFPAPAVDLTGSAVGFVPDWGGDEGSEIAIGSPGADTALGYQVGATHVFFSETLAP
jgi:hypothetical protein